MSDTPESTHQQSPQDRERLAPREPVLAAGEPVPGLGSWVLERKLGGGGFGEVWLARHALNDQLPPRAVKFCTDPDARHRLVTHEKNVVARVMKYAGHHPNIVPLLDYNLDGDVPWLMYEYVAGGTLANRFAVWAGTHPQERIPAALSVLVALADGLATMHDLDPPIVHRDLKPANVLMHGSVPRLADFGLGSVVMPNVPNDSTGAHTAAAAQVPTALRGAGTRLYASPEQMLGAAPDPRDDVYALGVLAYQLVTGAARTAPGTDAATELRELNVPDELIALIVRSVSVNPGRRPNGAREWHSALGALVARSTPPPGAPPASTDSANRTPSAAPLHPSDGPASQPTGSATELVPPARPVRTARRGAARAVGALAVGALAVASLVAYINSPPRGEPRYPDPAPANDSSANPESKGTGFPSRPKPGHECDVEIAPNTTMRFCYVPAGECQLGSPDGEMQALLELRLAPNARAEIATEAEGVRGKFATNGFWFGKYEVTQAEWAAVMRDTLLNAPSWCSRTGGGAQALGQLRDTSRFPVDSVSWVDCQEFLRRASAHHRARGGGEQFGLPHEDEWEYACRGGLGNGRAFHFGDALDGRLANCDGRLPFGTDDDGTALMRTAPVGTYEHLAPHPWGLCDLHGSVWEWCANLYQDARRLRVVRGGSWDTAAWSCRSARRGWYEPTARGTLGGLRVLATTSPRPAP